MSDDWMRALEELREEGEVLQARANETQREILELLEIPETGSVALVFDEQGLIADVAIDPAWRNSLSPEEFVQDVNFALVRTSGLFGSTAAAPPTQSFLEQVMATFNSPAARAPEEISNDFKTLTVTAVLGKVSSISADSRWIKQTPDALIAEEIVRISRIAAFQTDTFGRYSSEDPR